MYTKEEIYNLALGALLLQRQVSDTATDKSNEVKVLNTHWPVALRTTLDDLDLDSTSSLLTLSLAYSDPNDLWDYAYTYPSDCVFLRRIFSGHHKDNRTSHISKAVGIHEGDKVIFTDEEDAVAQYISKDVSLSSLNAYAGLAMAYNLAILSSPLIVGKGAKTLRKDIREAYIIAKAQAQEQDKKENFNYYRPEVESEFAEARMT